MKKYVLTEETKAAFGGVALRQIKAVRSFGFVNEGDLGGWIEKESNLSHDGDAQVSGSAQVFGDAWVSGDARIDIPSHIVWVSSVGSEFDTLTAYATKSGEIEVVRGCYRGRLNEFEEKVKQRHSGNRYADEYIALIEYIRLRFRGVAVNLDGKGEEER